MKTCFSEGKLMKQFGNPPFLREHPLSTNPPISDQFFYDPSLCPNFKNKKFPLILGGEETTKIPVFYLKLIPSLVSDLRTFSLFAISTIFLYLWTM